jgi:hypothetical protein
MPFFLTPPDCQQNIHSHEYGSLSFGQFFGVSNHKHSMGSPLAVIEQKQARVEMSQDVLQVLQLARHRAWKCIAALDEACFYLQVILIGYGFHMMNCHHLSRNKRFQVRN